MSYYPALFIPNAKIEHILFLNFEKEEKRKRLAASRHTDEGEKRTEYLPVSLVSKDFFCSRHVFQLPH